ncbi:MAG: class I SAM-dependent methyltransferase [Vicinamibacterales bacterium]
MTTTVATLRASLGDVDIYLLDQVLRGRISERDVVLDAGCGHGRNAAFLWRIGCRVLAADADPDAVSAVRALAGSIAPGADADDIRQDAVEALSFDAGAASVVVSSAVLHFAADDEQFLAMLRGMWRVLRPGGIFFARLATTIGLAHVGATPLGGRRYRLGDGTTRFLADEPWLMQLTADLGGQLADPLKTTIVQGQRCMTTWVARKPRGGEGGVR